MLRKPDIESDFGIRFDDYFAAEQPGLEALQTDGLIRMSHDEIAATPLGCIFLRNIGMVFDKYLRQAKRERPVFSKTL